jgi:hypothetical protein
MVLKQTLPWQEEIVVATEQARRKKLNVSA